MPGLRPVRWRSERSFGFFVYGLPDDGGRDDVEESRDNLSANGSDVLYTLGFASTVSGGTNYPGVYEWQLP